MISIVIPCKTEQEAYKCVKECQKLVQKDKEIIVLPDSLTGKVSPAQKRNIGIKMAKGEYIAFIDADAYPDPFWLNYSVQDAAGWCGPGILPPNSPLAEKISDWVLKLLPFNYRVTKKRLRYINDYPTFNLIIKKSVLELVGGFKTDTLTGEDSDLCQRITDLGMKIVYLPYVVVYHRRRSFPFPFLRQVATYSTHRGFFFKKGIGSSRKLVYCLPSLCLLLLLCWWGYRLLH